MDEKAKKVYDYLRQYGILFVNRDDIVSYANGQFVLSETEESYVIEKIEEVLKEK
jgi:hypothetical protein